MKKFCNADYDALRNVQNLTVSPAGTHAVYTLQRLNPAADAYQTCLWLLDLRTGDSRRLTSGTRDNGAFWLDETHVAFSGIRGEPAADATVLYAIDITGGEAEEYLRIPRPGAQISYLGGSRFLARIDTDVNREAEKEAPGWRFFDEYPYIGDGAGYVNKHRRALFLWDNEQKELKQLTAPLMQTYMTYFSEDVIPAEDGFFFVGYEYDRDAAGKACICKYLWQTGETRVLCTDDCYVFSFVRFGDRIHYAAWAIEAGPKIAAIRIRSVSEGGGDLRTDAEPDWELGSLRQREGKTMVIRTLRSVPEMARWEPDGSFTRLATPGVCPTRAIPVGEDVVFTAWEPNRLQEVYRWRGGEVVRLTHHNDELYRTYAFSKPEPLTVRCGDEEIRGWVMKPTNFESGKRYPGILNVHGGPHGCFNESFVMEHQRWCSEGYFVFFCNPQGSTTYGLEFMNVTGQLGESDFEQLMCFTDRVLEACPELDGNRLAITGQSYGGYMSNWAIGHTDRFRAAVPRMSISNWISMHGTSDERWYGDHVIAATPWKDPLLAWKQSPICYADRVKTPTLLIQHEKDQRCPLEQAQQMYLALLERGVPTKLMVNLGCFHGGRKVSQLFHDIDVMLEWFAAYLTEEACGKTPQGAFAAAEQE